MITAPRHAPDDLQSRGVSDDRGVAGWTASATSVRRCLWQPSMRAIVGWALFGLLGTTGLAIAVAVGSTPAYAANLVQLVMGFVLLLASTSFGRRARTVHAALPGIALSLAWTAYLVGLVAWNVGYLTDAPPRSPAVWDIAYIAALPLIGLSILAMPLHRAGVASVVRLLLDGLLVGAGLLVLSWGLWVDDVLHPPQWTSVHTVGTLYTVFNHLLLGVGIVVLVRTWLTVRNPILWMTLGAGIFAVAGIFEVANGFGATTFDARWLYVPFTLVIVPFGIGGLLAARSPERLELDTRPVAWKSLFPVAVVSVGGIVGIAAPKDHAVPTLILVGLLSILVARECLAFVERRRRELRGLADLMEAESRERRRIADDLHDDVLQQLFAVRWDLEDLTETADSPTLRAARETVDACVADIRRLLSENHPAVQRSLDLATTIDAIVQRQRRRSAVAIDVTVAPGPSCPNDVVVATVARELVANAVRHAEASRIEVRVRRSAPGPIELTVTDDGRGIPPGRLEAAASDGHVGLASSIARVEAAGGRLRIEAGVPRGTRISVALPPG